MSSHSENPPEDKTTGTCLIVYPLIQRGPQANASLSPEARLDEAAGLARAINLDVLDALVVKQSSTKPATYISSGHIEEIEGLIKHLEVKLIIVDASISPVQQRNLEEVWQCKVIDRTGLILEIFGERARTAEGKLQVELASLSYQRSRLVRSWTHLERQRGGFGFMGGPGESQLEVDRRLIDDRIGKLKKQLEKVKKTRGLHRKARQKIPYPVVALVGYTNAGKSTLFNKLTSAHVMAEDLLFATLDPTMRSLKLPSGREVILSDTVGFISDLPTDLVAAFRATLEEVVAADLILHVRDISSANTEHQREDVLNILDDLELRDDYDSHAIEVLNKADLLGHEKLDALKDEFQHSQSPKQVLVSALKGEGVPVLLKDIDAFFSAQCEEYHIKVPIAEGAKVAWLYRHGEVIARRDDEDYSHLSVKLTPGDKKKFERIDFTKEV